MIKSSYKQTLGVSMIFQIWFCNEAIQLEIGDRIKGANVVGSI